MLSKRVMARSLYQSPCPHCGYATIFAASNIVEREYRNPCPEKNDYDTISYNLKCQVCLHQFVPTRHRTANFFTNPMKDYLLTDTQKQYISQMKSFSAAAPSGIGGIRLGQRTDELRHSPRFDNVSVFLVDEVAGLKEETRLYITGHNLSADILARHLGLENICEVPVAEAMDFHFHCVPQMLGDVSRVTRT